MSTSENPSQERDEEVLTGGNVNEVRRVGDTVRRSAQPDAHIRRLLLDLERAGCTCAPRFLGTDELGREILSYIPGEVPGNDYPEFAPYIWSDDALEDMGRLLRRYHDATHDLLPQALADGWRSAFPDAQPCEVICHNDAAPYNTVFRDGRPVALIDFDMACPGSRIWDIAYALYTWVPLGTFEPSRVSKEVVPFAAEHAEMRHRRIGLFFAAYGMPVPGDLMHRVILRIKALCKTLRTGAAEGNAAFQRMIDEGHLAHYLGEIEFLTAQNRML